MTEIADMTTKLPTGLTGPEAEYVYNMEVLGLPNRKAASLAGLDLGQTYKPHLLQARELMKRELRGHMQITKEDVVFGIREAVGRAQILSEPMTEIVGWEKIGKLLGYDAPQKVDINITASIEVLQQHVKGMSDAELVKLLGAGGVIDGEFYEVGNGQGSA